MRNVTVTITMEVADDVTDEQLEAWLPALAAQAEEPTITLPDGNEDGFSSRDVWIECSADGQLVCRA